MGSGCGRRALGTLGDKEGTPGGDKNPAQHRLNSALFTSHNTPGQGEEEMGRQSPSGPGGGHTQPQGTHTTPPTPEPPSRTPPCTQTPQSPTGAPAATVTLWGSPAQHGEGFLGGVHLSPLCPAVGGSHPPGEFGATGFGEEKQTSEGNWGGAGGCGQGGPEGLLAQGRAGPWGGTRGFAPLSPPGSSSPL